MKALKDSINQNMNPFANNNETGKDILYNIATGKSTTETVTSFLTNVLENGKTLRENFISECAALETRFEEPIKILNFVSANAEKK